MCLISQDGMIDSLYEQMIVNIVCTHPNQILASGCNCEKAGSLFLVAKYSTEEKAIKAMKMLRDAYMCYATVRSDGGVFQFPSDEGGEGEDE